MIRVKRLKELLAQVPDDARVYAYEGECVGIVIREGTPGHLVWDSKKKRPKLTERKGRSWFISAHDGGSQAREESRHEGFKQKGKR